MHLVHALGAVHERDPTLKPHGGFVKALNARLKATLATLEDNQMGLLHPDYMLRFCDDGQRRDVLHRCAQLELGLREENKQYLQTMQKVESALRHRTFALMSTLPRFTKDYCARVKAAT